MEMGPKYRIAVRKLGYTYSGYLRGTPSVCLTFCLLNYTLYPCVPFSFSDWLLLLLILCVSCDGWPRLDSMLPFVSSTAIITLISQSPNSVSQKFINPVHFLQNRSKWLARQINVMAAFRLKTHPQNNPVWVPFGKYRATPVTVYNITGQYSSLGQDHKMERQVMSQRGGDYVDRKTTMHCTILD